MLITTIPLVFPVKFTFNTQKRYKIENLVKSFEVICKCRACKSEWFGKIYNSVALHISKLQAIIFSDIMVHSIFVIEVRKMIFYKVIGLNNSDSHPTTLQKIDPFKMGVDKFNFVV